ncbi:MAG TPA: hypothetical protein PLI43_04375 [Albidovulum sp.]|uniref:hypothetical protein n=1 Tax=Albidovulum sp. TaxID=1872424 RepID=UPI002D011D75|nr:hypothetical protein [Albidovulum sp.]
MSDATSSAAQEQFPDLIRNRMGQSSALVAAAGALIFSALVLGFLWGRTVNHDVAWYLIATREWLGGARLYVDIYEVNPPLNFYLTAPAVFLADLTGIADGNALSAMICVWMFISLLASWTILSRQDDLPTSRRLVFLFGVALALFLPALRDIGQREQLMVIFATPWLLAQLPRRERLSPLVTMALAAVAAVGICLKPYFLLLPLSVTLWQVLSARSLRPVLSLGNLTMFTVGIAYVAAAYVLHPEYFSDVIPVARLVYGTIALSDEVLYRVLAFRALPFLPFAVILLVSRPDLPGIGVLAAATLAGLCSYFLQWNGFPYHLVPFSAFAVMTAFWVLVRVRSYTPLAMAACIGLSLTAFRVVFFGPYKNGYVNALLAQTDPAWKPDGLMVLSTQVMPGPPVALALHTRWTSRYPHAWLIPGALNGLQHTDCAVDKARCDQLTAILDRSRRENVDDLVKGRPDILAIHKGTDFVDASTFSWYELMRDVPGWAEALRDYKQMSSGQYFDIWLRCTGATGAIAASCDAAK